MNDKANTFPVIDFMLDNPDAKDIMKHSRDENMGGYCIVYDENGKNLCELNIESFHSRGHNSYKEEKIGYGFKLSEKANLLNMGDGKKYALFPCYRNNCLVSYIINKDISERLGYGYNLDLVPVHVNLNDEYIGLYLLAEKIEFSPSRVYFDTPGAFIVELGDKYYYQKGEPDRANKDFIDFENDSFILRDTLEISRDEAIDKLETAYNAMFDENEIWHYWDIDSVACLIAAGFMASEVSLESSIYFLYNPNDGKLHALPYWDCEHSYCRISEEKRLTTLESWYAHVARFIDFYRVFENNKELNAKMNELYENSLRDIYIDISNQLNCGYYDIYINDMKMDSDIYSEISRDNEYWIDVDSKFEQLKYYFDTEIDIADKEFLRN